MSRPEWSRDIECLFELFLPTHYSMLNPSLRFLVTSAIFALAYPLAIHNSAAAAENTKADRETIHLSGTGWTLWRDTNASWEHDELFLPPADLSRIPLIPQRVGGSNSIPQRRNR